MKNVFRSKATARNGFARAQPRDKLQIPIDERITKPNRASPDTDTERTKEGKPVMNAR